MVTSAFSYLIFLSYASPDIDAVSAASRALEGEGLRTFLAKHDVPHGISWRDAIYDALRKCDALVAFLSASFRASEWTDQEVGFVFGRGRRALPVRLSGAVTPHGFLNTPQAPDISGMNGPAIATIIIDALLEYPEERDRLINFVVGAIENDRDATRLRTTVRRLSKYPKLSGAHLDRVRSAAASNSVLRRDRDLRVSLERVLEMWGSE